MSDIEHPPARPNSRRASAGDARERRTLKSFLFGRSATRTVIGLVVGSIMVGAAFSFIGLNPREFWNGLFHFMQRIFAWLGDSLGEVLGSLATYLLIGAAVVVPIWFVARLLSGGRK